MFSKHGNLGGGVLVRFALFSIQPIKSISPQNASQYFKRARIIHFYGLSDPNCFEKNNYSNP